MWIEGAWGVNAGVEGTNGATRNVGVGIDSPGGMVDGVRGKVNDASSCGCLLLCPTQCHCQHIRCECRWCKGCGHKVCQHGLRGVWGANAGAESMNGTTCNVGMGIDGLVGAVDGVRGEVNNACMFWGNTSVGM